VLEVSAPALYDTATRISGSEARPIHGELAKRLQAAASAAFQGLGGRGFARFDFRVPPSDEPYLLEGNMSPGVIRNWSLFSKAAAAIALPYNDLIERMLMTAFLPHRRAVPPVAAYSAPPFPDALRPLLPDLPVELQPPGLYQATDEAFPTRVVFRHAC
jgi:hypothetical protein